jgi:transcriptional regulator with XRE-family HTH domain
MSPEEFKNIRLTIGYGQAEFAELIGISESTVQSYETGRRAIPHRNEILITAKTNDLYVQAMETKNVQKKFNKDVRNFQIKGFPHQTNDEPMMMTVMANATTSSVTLDLVCEVLAKISGVSLDKVKARAKQLAQERGQKLSTVLHSLT